MQLSIFAILLVDAAILVGHTPPTAAHDDPPTGESAAATDAARASSPSERLAAARARLSDRPEDPALLLEAFRAARDAGAGDEALDFARRALRAPGGSDGPSKADRRELVTVTRELDPHHERRSAAESAFVDALLRTAGTFERKGLVANAADVLARVLHATNDPRAAAALDALRDDPATRRRVQRAGIVFPETDATRRERARWAAEHAKRDSWENAWTFRGDHYTVVTDVGYELGRDVLEAMEDMHAVYRAVFALEGRDVSAPHGSIAIHATRAGFDARLPGLPLRTKGVYVPAERRVVTYDPRDEDRPLDDLWATLFHEAAHAFTSRLSTTLPTWLDEGTACLFEGSQRTVRDTGVPFGIPEVRLSRVPQRLTDRPDAARAILAHRKNLPSRDYALAWAWIYFFHHFEDERAQTVYREPFRSYLASFADPAGGDASIERFVESFVTNPALEEVRSIEDLEARFRTWMLELHERTLGPPEAARVWISIAARQREAQRPEAAVASLRVALQRRPDDARARFDLAAGLRAVGDPDAALLEYRRLAHGLETFTYPEAPVPGFDTLDAGGLARRVAQEVRSLEPTAAESLPTARETYRNEVRALATEYRAAGYPRTAVACIDRALKLLVAETALSTQRDAIAADLPGEPPPWRRVSPALAPSGWDLEASAWTSADGRFESGADAPHVALFREPGRAGARFEVSLLLPDREGAGAGIVFGCGPESLRVVLALGNGPVLVGPVRDGGVDEIRAIANHGESRTVDLALEMRDAAVDIYLNGEAVGRETFECQGKDVRFGLFAQSSGVRFDEVRIRVDESRGSPR